jgi:NADH:ubiquinone oxidoreductase subunit 5 (subunit L)/multisubunit Na+/H+ antiporter MnhA subunit
MLAVLIGGLLSLVALVSGVNTVLAVPIGPASPLHLAIDPVAASFILLVFVVTPWSEAAPLRLVGAAIALLAGDGFTLAAGVLLLGGGSGFRVCAGAAVCLVVALALAGPLGDFAAWRAAPPEGWSAFGAMVLTLAAAGLISRINPAIAFYLVLRVLFDLCGPGQPLWWGALLLLAGAAIALAGSLRASLADTLHTTASAAPLVLFGMAGIALGVALMARAVDLPSVASLALEAAWLALVTHVLCRTLLSLLAKAVEGGAGTRRLDRLGGLIHRMPISAAGCLAGLLAIAMLPPGPGFAALWLLFQSLLAAARFGGLALQILIACIAVIVATSAGLVALAAVRLFGTVFLGRPRTPRAAAADEAPGHVRFVLTGLATAIALFGPLPALALLLAAGWIMAPDGVPLLVLRAGADMPGYAPLAVAAPLAFAGFAAKWLQRGEPRREPVWTGGFAAPPHWLPFGDPATQYGPASFVEPVRRIVAMLPRVPGRGLLERGSRAVLRVATALMAP